MTERNNDNGSGKVGEKLKDVMDRFKPTKVLSTTKVCDAVQAKEPNDNNRIFNLMRGGRGGMGE